MDRRPVGARPQPPDKRIAAYNSLFPSRPQLPPPAPYLPYPPQYRPQQSPPQFLAPSPYSQNYARARSVASSPHTSATVQPRPPSDTPDPTLERFTRSGMTPAQAYQAQVYLNSPQSHSQQPSFLLPKVDQQDGKLGVDFLDDPQPEPVAGPLHIDTNSNRLSTHSNTSLSPSTPDIPLSSPSRRSSESVSTMPGPRRGDRALSMSAAIQRRSLMEQMQGTPPPVPTKRPKQRTPIVYPALLSRVAAAFQDRIPLSDRVKDDLTYKDAFDGREAVDKISYIIKTTDRTLALLLGRALDSQKFFHDVTYDHRLRDSPHELYQFRTIIPSPFVSGELPQQTRQSDIISDSISVHASQTLPRALQEEDNPLPSGVFTLLTDCYSPTCSRDSLCYSIVCPRRLEQQARLNVSSKASDAAGRGVLAAHTDAANGAAAELTVTIDRQKEMGDEAEKQDKDDTLSGEASLWIHTVPPEIVASVSDKEKKRQEAINEIIYTEKDFVRDMEYLRDVWLKRLRESDVIPEERRTTFLEQVFWNIHDIVLVSTRLRDALVKRQKSYAVVERLGDIFLDAVPHFHPFVSYGAHQLYGKFEFEKEKSSNPAFAQFVELTERLPESRKLELNAYLTKPTTRLARYPLLLGAIQKHTPADSPDAVDIPKVIDLVRGFLAKVNEESGKTENHFNLIQLSQNLMWKPGEEVNLRLKDEGRELVYKGSLSKRDGEIMVWLFDHAVLFGKPTVAKGKGHEAYRVYRRPIPLELLLVSGSGDDLTTTQRSRRLVRKNSLSSINGTPSTIGHTQHLSLRPNLSSLGGPEPKGSFWINFQHLGRKYYNLVLYASNQLTHKKWLEAITKQQALMRERSNIFDTICLSEQFFTGGNKVNCAAPFDGGRKVVYGTDDGVYVSDVRVVEGTPVKVLELLEVSQVDVLEDYQLLIVLAERQVITFPLDALDPRNPSAALKRAKRIASHTTFFKAGYCLGRVLVCIVKSSQLSSTFKTLEPIDSNTRGRSKPTLKQLLQGGNDTLKPFREFYIPVESTSIHYLKTKMCVGCSRGFEIVDLETLDTQGLLDPNDEQLEFVRRRENLRPMAIYRILHEFLLCYDEFAFYVNKTGKRSRKDFMVYWEGNPTAFALHGSYVLAVEPSFIEIRHIETGHMSQVIQGSNLRLLFADTPPSVQPQPPTYSPNQYVPQYNQPYNPYANSPYMSQPGYGMPPQGIPYHVNHPNPPRSPQVGGRDEIIIVSDDKVLALKPVAGQVSSPQSMLPDNASTASMPLSFSHR